ncbi:hypothetical protein LIER_23811 [Lithospermum erythrorhizon]|uniref:Polyprotein n=1 Tax=Lithospermum erythrorhizon TaxID=34254 RepID=A0AAV3R2S0_LITER
MQELVLQGDVSREILCQAKDITMKYNLLCKVESEWYKDEDDNTKLFHSSMRINQSKSLITQIYNAEGVFITDYQQVQVVVIEFYKKHFPAQATTINKQDLITCAVKKRINVVDFEDLQKPVTVEEIETVQSFFHTYHLPRYVNCTALTLIPKVKHPHSMKDFRLISCCNMLYKGISSIIAHKFRKILHKIVGDHQTAYVLDDLCIVCYANKESICTIKNVFIKFGETTELKPNLSKSFCFFAGVSNELEDALSGIIDIPKDSLPIKYLGIPPRTKHVSARDCRPLIDKIRGKIDG